MDNQLIEVKVSAKWANQLFSCNVDYIRSVCRGRCCQGSKRILISLLPTEAQKMHRFGFEVKDNLLQPAANGLCPAKADDGLCRLHGSLSKPFGCVASPFTFNKNKTLVIRHRYVMMPCHGKGQLPAYVTFRASLDAIFGKKGAALLCEALTYGTQDVITFVRKTTYDNMVYLDSLK